MPDPLGRITTYSSVISTRYNPDKFVGREWLIEEVTRFCDDEERRHLIIVGEPGSGKSAFLAYLAKTWNCPRHFIRVGSIDGVTGVDPRHFLISLGAQLYQKYGRQIFEHAEDGNIRVTVGLAGGKKEIVGRFIDELYTLPFLPLSERDVQVAVGAAIGHSRIVGEHIGKLINAAEMLDEKTLLHIALLNPLQKLQELYPAEKVVILIDALDEAHYHSGVQIPDILPRATDADVPGNLRLVLTSRPGEAADKFRPEDWLKLDDVDKGYKAQNLRDIGIYIKRQLVTTPFTEVIRSWSQLDKQAYQHEIEVKSDGNFLYLYHFFNELASVVEAGQTDLHSFRVPKGLDEIYRFFAVEKIRQNLPTVIQFSIVGDVPDAVKAKLLSLPTISGVQLQGKEVELMSTDTDAVLPELYKLGIPIAKVRLPQMGVWEEKYLPILGVMAVAYEPLYREQIAGFARVEVNYVDTVLAQLKQFLDEVADERATAYQFYHPSFSEYLLDGQQNRDYPLDELKYHAQIASYYREERAIWQGVKNDLAVQSRREYGLKYYIMHLFQAQEWQQLFLILDSAEYGRAKIRHGPGAFAYAQDLELGQRAVCEVTREELNTTNALALLPNLWRYSLLRSNLGNTDSYPDTAFNVMVALGQQERALELVPLLTDPFRRTMVLVSIGIQIAEEWDKREEEAWRVLLRACDVMRENIGRDPGLIQSVLQELEEVRPFALQVPFLDEVAKITLAINDNTLKITTLVAIAAALMKTLQQYRAQEITQTVTQTIAQAVEQTISNADQDTKVLREIVETLVKVQLWDSAIAIAHSIGDERQRGDARAHIIHGLLASYAWDKAKALAMKVEGNSQFYALAMVARARAKAQPELAEELLSEIESLTHDWDFKNQDYRLKVVVDDLAMAHLWDRAIHAVWSIHDDEHKVEAIRGLARAMTEAGKQEQVTALLTRMTKTVCHEQKKDVVLVKVVETLLDAQLWDNAEVIARVISDLEQKCSAIVAVASMLATARPEHAQELLTEVETSIRSNGRRTRQSDQVLRAIISTLAQMHLWDRARAVAHIGSEEAKLLSHASLQIANALAEMGEWDHAVSAALESNDDYEQGQTLRAIVNRLIELHVWDKAISIAHVISDYDQQSEALIAILQALVAVKDWNKALTVARAISVERQKAAALKVEIEALEMEQIRESVKNSTWSSNLSDDSDAVNEMDGEDEENSNNKEDRDYAEEEDDEGFMLSSGSLLSQEMALLWDSICATAQSLSNERIQSETLANLFEVLITLRLWDRALKIAFNFTRAKDRGDALFALSLSLAASGLWGNAAAIARRISESGYKAEALAITALSVAAIDQPRAETLLSEALASDQSTNNDGEVESETLARLAARLARKGQWDRAVTIIRTLQHTPKKVETFIALANNIALAEPEHAVSLLSEAASVARTLGGEERTEQLSEVAEAFHKIGQKEQVRALLAEIMTLAGRDPENFDWSVLDTQDIGDTDDGTGIQDENWDENSEEKVIAQGKKTMRVSRPEQAAEIVFRRMGSERSFSEEDTTLRDLASTLAGKRLWHQAVALTWSIRDPRQKVMALTRIVIALVQAEQLDRARLLLQEAEAVAYSMEDDDDSDAASYKELSDRDFALNELVKAQTIALDVEGAEAAARSMSKDQHPLKDLALCQVIRVLAKTQQWDRAIELIRHIGEHKWRVSAWTTVSDAFIAQGEYARALRLIQERWIHAPTRNDLLQLLPLAMDFIALRPELGWEFYEAFSWTDKFLEA